MTVWFLSTRIILIPVSSSVQAITGRINTRSENLLVFAARRSLHILPKINRSCISVFVNNYNGLIHRSFVWICVVACFRAVSAVRTILLVVNPPAGPRAGITYVRP